VAGLGVGDLRERVGDHVHRYQHQDDAQCPQFERAAQEHHTHDVHHHVRPQFEHRGQIPTEPAVRKPGAAGPAEEQHHEDELGPQFTDFGRLQAGEQQGRQAKNRQYQKRLIGRQGGKHVPRRQQVQRDVCQDQYQAHIRLVRLTPDPKTHRFRPVNAIKD
jgi:hypothetical protein